MTTAIFAGSFDPLTNGHRDIIVAAGTIAEKLIIAIGVHPGKQPLFTFDERVKIIKSCLNEWQIANDRHFEIVAFDNLLVDKSRELGASVIIRGLRDGSDFDYEMQMVNMNAVMAPKIKTIFIPASSDTRAISATLVRQIAFMGGDVSPFVPKTVVKALAEKFETGRQSADRPH